ncbi:zinc-ribbon domain-containing protein [Phycobacter azelaicus]|uniref:zinc-ribbon domain-containing protein n=1 Tax=Phycobacter azelaicus TaxID=2668075 RepID=UPI001867D301|nr:zinc-ribbon domain-containing protein [Phycobacter azelaicus]MBE1295343.1 thioredoxin [Paracoccaceae bacterium]
MRLTCPNCAAQYEVPDDVIPDEGRDVQCSNCGTTWFEGGSETAQTQATAEPAAAEPEGEAPLAQEGQSEQVSSQPQTEDEDATPDREPDAEPAPELAEPEPQLEATARPQRGLDPALSDILREEAEREASLRAAAAASAAAQGLESQPNLGLDDLSESESALRARQVKDRMARLQGQDPRQLAAEESGQRRDMLPDIEEINSTLRAGDTVAAAQSETEEVEPPRKNGFARGFALTILLFLLLLMIYTNAGQIAQTMPQADPYLSAFVTWVDQARIWLDAQVKALQAPQL